MEKKHVENMYRVKDAHPGLDGTFDFLRNNGDTVEGVAEAIRGVPMWGQQPMSHSDILHHLKKIPRDCGYKDLEQEGPTLNKELQERSNRMYEKRKKEEVTRMDVFKCFIHPSKKERTVLKMSK